MTSNSLRSPGNCPFCGERAELKIGLATRYVMCLSCETMGPNLATGEECVAAWNMRTPDPRDAILAKMAGEIIDCRKKLSEMGGLTITGGALAEYEAWSGAKGENEGG